MRCIWSAGGLISKPRNGRWFGENNLKRTAADKGFLFGILHGLAAHFRSQVSIDVRIVMKSYMTVIS
jgi:hypothetical protein